MQKPRSDSFSEKISPDQRLQLFDWLSDHSYSETAELVSAPAPEGFGMEVSRSTLSRFYKTHFPEIEKLRHDKFSSRAVHQINQNKSDPSYRALLEKSADLFLQDRYFEALTHPVESIDDLKKLVVVARKIRDLRLRIEPEREIPPGQSRNPEQLIQMLDAVLGGKRPPSPPPL